LRTQPAQRTERIWIRHARNHPATFLSRSWLIRFGCGARAAGWHDWCSRSAANCCTCTNTIPAAATNEFTNPTERAAAFIATDLGACSAAELVSSGAA
jgi:hypothetical protein